MVKKVRTVVVVRWGERLVVRWEERLVARWEEVAVRWGLKSRWEELVLLRWEEPRLLVVTPPMPQDLRIHCSTTVKTVILLGRVASSLSSLLTTGKYRNCLPHSAVHRGRSRLSM